MHGARAPALRRRVAFAAVHVLVLLHRSALGQEDELAEDEPLPDVCSECRVIHDVDTCQCVCAAREDTGVDLTALSGKVFQTSDDEGRSYLINLCGAIAKEELPPECSQLDLDAQPSVVRFSTRNPADCETLGSMGTMSVTKRDDDDDDAVADVVFPSEMSAPPLECAQDLRGSRTFVLVLTHADSDGTPGAVQATQSNYFGSTLPCDSYTARWPTASATAATAADEDANGGNCGEVNALYITVPFFSLLVGTAITFVRKAKAGTGSMPFGLPNMTTDQISVFALCYMTYVLYHALRAGFSGCKSSMVAESGFTKQQMGNMDTGFLLSYGAGQFFWGSLADKVSAKITTVNGMYAIAAVVVFYTGVEVLGLDPSLTMAGAVFFVIARVVEGFLQATGWSGTLTMTSDWFGAAHRGAVMGVMSTNANVGNIVGEIVVGSVFAVIPGVGGWQTALFVLSALLGAMGYVNSKRLVYPPPPDFELPPDQQLQGVKDRPDDTDAAQTTTSHGEGSADGSSATDATEALGIIEACKIPGVIPYALSYCFLKLVTYSLLFWLPFYLVEGAGLCKTLAALMATLNDVGMVAGGITAGWLSDKLTHKAGTPVRTPIVVVGLLLAIVPIGLLTVSTSSAIIATWITLAGFFLGMPAECSTSAVCIDLAKSQPKAATATVIGIIDGTGALGAAAGQQMVAYASEAYGWESVFNVLVMSLLLSASMVHRMAIRDFGYLRAATVANSNAQLEMLSAPKPAGAAAGAAAVGAGQEVEGYAPPVLDEPGIGIPSEAPPTAAAVATAAGASVV